MISDGYYAAAAQPRITPSPVPGPPLPPGQPTYVAQPSGPGVGYPGQYTGGSGGAPYQGQSPSTPWPQQPGGAASWPGAVAPGDGGPDALGQYRLGRRNPTGAEIPGAVVVATRLMYTGLAATVIALLASLPSYSMYARAAANDKKHYYLTAEAAHQNQMAGLMALAVATDFFGIACWIMLAIACRRGRGWTRVTASVLLGVYTVIMLLVLGGTDHGARFWSLLVWVLGVAALIPLWSRQARDFFATWGRH
jgi:hypothetical protein